MLTTKISNWDKKEQRDINFQYCRLRPETRESCASHRHGCLYEDHLHLFPLTKWRWQLCDGDELKTLADGVDIIVCGGGLP
jgi:hypothetical protein